ncbi:hypothetical protein Tsubulata_046721 [Turnera subulata]|uniref:Protein kinase domain-containing protein n=1 Tax=Turnera subulata TaxID=218843 RepID=A0A9Q0FZD9_9ROSI|nr:hypothetical protein Tsubulata_046721 [Turnera subulata]
MGIMNRESQGKINPREANKRRRAYVAHHVTFKTAAPSTLESSHGVSWTRQGLLGRGGFGSVFLAETRKKTANIHYRYQQQQQQELPSQVAVKSATFANSLSLMHEKRVLRDLQACPHILKCYGDEVVELRSGDKVYNLLLEYCSGFNLEHWIIKSGIGLPESHIKSYVRDILSGLKYVHDRGYVHCDIKPCNILLVPEEERMPTGYVAKIADFGLAIKEEEVKKTGGSMRGTTRYMSPELVRKKQIGYGVDIWALGCSVVEMLSGKVVWYEGEGSVNADDLLRVIGYTEYLPQLPRSVSDDALDFVLKCLCRDPVERWSAEKLLAHPFLYPEDPETWTQFFLDYR